MSQNRRNFIFQDATGSSRLLYLVPVLCTVAISIYVLVFFGHFEGLDDANNFADLARNIASGEGFVNHDTYPVSFAFSFLRKLPQPDVLWAPLYSVFLAGAFKVFGATDRTILFANTALYILLLWLAWFYAIRLFGLGVAALAVLILTVNNMLHFVLIECMSELLFAVLFLLLTLCLFRFEASRTKSVLAGILLGLCYLTRYQSLLLAVYPLVIILRKRSFSTGALLFTSFLATISPWLTRNLLLSGDPFFTIQSFGEYSKSSPYFPDFYYAYRSLDPIGLWEFVTVYPTAAVRKAVSGILFFGREFPFLIGAFATALGLGGLGLSVKRGRESESIWTPGARHLAAFLAASIILTLPIGIMGGHHLRHLAFAVAPLAILSAAGIGLLGKRFLSNGKPRRIVFAIIILLCLVPPDFPQAEEGYIQRKQAFPSEYSTYLQAARRIEPGSLVASDASDALAWYCRVNTVWLPYNLEELLKIDELVGVRYIFISGEMGGEWLEKVSPTQLERHYAEIWSPKEGVMLFERVTE